MLNVRQAARCNGAVIETAHFGTLSGNVYKLGNENELGRIVAYKLYTNERVTLHPMTSCTVLDRGNDF